MTIFELSINYPFLYDRDKELSLIVGKHPHSSGTGLRLDEPQCASWRDMQWDFESMADAQTAADRIKKLDIAGLILEIWPREAADAELAARSRE